MSLLSIVIPTFNNWTRVERHFAIRERLSSESLRNTELIVVDDHSDFTFPQLEAPANTLVLRVVDDIPWNQGGARNLGVSLAKSDWLPLTDVEHFFEAATLESILASLDELDDRSLYRPTRILEKTGEPEPELGLPLNVFLASRKAYWDVGGVDEDFVGHYGYEDREFMDRWRRSGRGQEVHATAVCRVDGGGSTRGLSRDVARNRVLLEKKLSDPDRPAPMRHIRFGWEQVLDNRIF